MSRTESGSLQAGLPSGGTDAAPAAGDVATVASPTPGRDATKIKRLELTPRALITAAVVAALIGALYPFVVLKIGYGPNISVVSAFFGFIALSVVGFFTGVRGTRWENKLVQTAGMLGVLLAVPLRRHFIDEENLTFADGTAAGETLLVLDVDRTQAARRVNA